MSPNMSVGGAGGAERIPAAIAVPKVKAESRPAGGKQAVSHPAINSAKGIKQAEEQGQNLSIGEEQLILVIERANKAMQGIYTSFEFSIHEGTKEIMVKVLDRDTGEVVREIPSEKILDMVAKMWELAGIFVDERR